MLYEEYLKNRHKYQAFGADFLLEKKHACLFYKPGLGKTYPVIEATREVVKSGKNKVLVLSTADAIRKMWLTEIKPQNILPIDTEYMTFNKAIQDDTAYALTHRHWDVVIVDEVHRCKAINTKTSRLLHKLTKHVEYVFGLTGTPRGNTDVDIFCQLHNLNVSEWGTISYTKFVDAMCDTKNVYTGSRVVQVPIGISERYRAAWEANLSQYTQRVNYDDGDVEMPKLVVTPVSIKYEKTKAYLDAMDGIVSIGDEETTVAKLAAITKLHELANGYLYYDDLDDVRHVDHISCNGKLGWLKSNLKPNSVVVYQFAQDCEDVQELLEAKRLSYTDDPEYFKQGKADILLLQCSRCESFNLQMCNTLIFYTMDYSYIKYNQMLHRVWRIGQTSQVNIYVLIAEDTIEEEIWNAVRNKERLADLFMRVKGKYNG